MVFARRWEQLSQPLSNLHWSTFAATSRKNRYDGTKSNFVAILQLNVSNKNAIDLCPVC
jgi:hypothetical protein